MSGSFSRHAPPTSRQHSHSISLAATNPSHRVNRRKSVNAPTSSTAQAAIAAALREQGDASAIPLHGHRRSVGSRKTTETQSMSARPSMHSYFNASSSTTSGQDNDALEDNSPDEDRDPSSKSLSTKHRNRRASEGSYLSKGESKKSGSDLRCDTCGKGYKHSSCLTKHLYDNCSFVSSVLMLMVLGGSMTQHGQLPPSYLFRSTSKSNCWRPLRCCAT